MLEFDEGELTPEEREWLAQEAEARSGGEGLGKHVKALLEVLRKGAKPSAVALAVGALAYLVLTMDAVPDLLPGIGLADDAGVLAGAVAAVRRITG